VAKVLTGVADHRYGSTPDAVEVPAHGFLLVHSFNTAAA